MCPFHTRIFDSIENYVHNGKNKPYQEVGDSYVGLNVKPLKKCYIFRTEICDWVNNYVYHANFPHGLRGYICVPLF